MQLNGSYFNLHNVALMTVCMLTSFSLLAITVRGVSNKHCLLPFFHSWLFLIGSFSYLQVMITYMRAWMSLKFGQIQTLVSMVTDRVMMGKMVSPLFLGCFSSVPFHTCRQ